MQYAYSTDEESFSGPFDHPEDAIAEGLDEAVSCACAGPGDWATLHIGEIDEVAQPASAYFPLTAHAIVDQMDDEACDDGAPSSTASHFSNATVEALGALNRKIAACIDQWANEYGLQPRWFNVHKVREVTSQVKGTLAPTEVDDDATLDSALHEWGEIRRDEREA
jgi:hypothetical protein